MAGLVVAARTAPSGADAVRDLPSDLPGEAATRPYAERFSWVVRTQGQPDMFQAAFGLHRPVSGVTQYPE